MAAKTTPKPPTLVIKDTPTPQLYALRAEMQERPLAYKIHIKAIEITLRERGEKI
jgi:hypothetical protein